MSYVPKPCNVTGLVTITVAADIITKFLRGDQRYDVANFTQNTEGSPCVRFYLDRVNDAMKPLGSVLLLFTLFLSCHFYFQLIYKLSYLYVSPLWIINELKKNREEEFKL